MIRPTISLAALCVARGGALGAQTTITLAGRVVGPEGRPLAGAQVSLVNIAGTERRPTFGQPTGAFATRQAQLGIRVDW